MKNTELKVLEKYLLDYELRLVLNREKFAEAWRYLMKNLETPVAEVAVRFGFTPGAFRSWIQNTHAREVSERRLAAGLPPRKLIT